MDVESDTRSKEVDRTVKDNSDIEPVNIENMTIFSSYKILKDGTRIFSAED